MKLIDADTLIDNHFADNHNIALSYANKLWMRRIINEEDTIDPVHAAGGCYCKECLHSELVEYEDNEGWVTPLDEYWCNEHKNTMPLNGFCSEGRKDNTKNA